MNSHVESALPLKSVEMMPQYRIDDEDVRPWGHYIVTGIGRTDTGEEYCEKQIVIKPFNILSLQSHELRRETWIVRKGRLAVLLDGRRIDLPVGQAIEIPKGSVHCMANLTNSECIVQERQEGICREEDIRRYLDAYNRATEEPSGPGVSASVRAYRDILAEIRSLRAIASARIQ